MRLVAKGIRRPYAKFHGSQQKCVGFGTQSSLHSSTSPVRNHRNCL